jgi:hypothetical protein
MKWYDSETKVNVLTFFAIGDEVEVGHAPINRTLWWNVASRRHSHQCRDNDQFTLLFTMSLYVIGEP